jgi:hypothetical protein
VRATPRGWREFGIVLLTSAALAVALTYPLAFNLGGIARSDADGQFSIWNVAWVAHALLTSPTHVFDANIFYPHKGTLAYSENNLGAGVLAIPVYAATQNAYAAHNTVVLLAFMLSAIGTYYLVRHLLGDRRAAATSAIVFAFCPYLFAHMAHIQLLMTAGVPFSMLAFHRLAERPTAGRGATLGFAMAAQALSCGYYGVFIVLMVAYATVVVGISRRLWTDWRYFGALATAAAVAIAIVLPVFLPYAALQKAGFVRDLAAARFFSPNLSAYLASSSYAHAWMLDLIPQWKNEVAFPGFIATAFGIAGAWIARRTRRGELLVLYGGLAVLALWASFGPQAGLYTILYKTIPAFGLLRAPGRFCLIVAFGLAVLTGVAVSRLLERARRPNFAACAIAAIAAAELFVPLNLPQAQPFEPIYRVLASMPRGAVIEMPFFYPAVGLYQHTKYMVTSTTHWMPLVNGYSDYIPDDFYEHVVLLSSFPSRDSFKILEPNRVRYAVFHMYGYNDENRRDMLTRLAEFAQYLRPLYQDQYSRLYEIVGFPP